MNRLVSLLIVSILFNTVNVYAHSFFNADTRRIGEYKIQIFTIPEIPGEGESTKINLAVTNENSIDQDIVLSVKMFSEDEEVLNLPPHLIKGGHMVIDYIFDKPGQYILEVDIHEPNDVLKAKFNIGVTKEISMIFLALVILSILAPVGLVLWIMLKKRILKKNVRGIV